MEKIIQIPFSLPPVKTEAMRAFVEKTTQGQFDDPRCTEVFARDLEPNPRCIKRTLNIFLLLDRLAQNREDLTDRIKPVRLAKIVIIQQHHPRTRPLPRGGLTCSAGPWPSSQCLPQPSQAARGRPA